MKTVTIFECNECGEQYYKWQGRCPACNSWNTIIEKETNIQHNQQTSVTNNIISLMEKDVNLSNLTSRSGLDSNISLKSSANLHLGASYKTSNQENLHSKVMSLDKIAPHQEELRELSGNREFDRVLGGGIVHGSVILLGGSPGIGKSTLLLQVLGKIAKNNIVLYVTGEESLNQVASRASRLNIEKNNNFLLYAEVKMEEIILAISKNKPNIVIIDSIQTVYLDGINGSAGSVSQVRECANILVRIAKQYKISVIVVGHVTKDGSIAGPRVLEHLVDTVLYFEGDEYSNFRMLRSVKNRFGAVNELGVFAMTDGGLQEVANPSVFFLSSYQTNNVGSSILITQKGSRPILVEVQALLDYAYSGQPKRLALGIDSYRLSMLVGLIQKHLEIKLFDQDIFVNIVGGVKIIEPASDLAILLAIISSLRNKPIGQRIAVFGEIGLAGRVVAVQKGEDRIKEAAKMGFQKIIIPRSNLPKKNMKLTNCEIIPVDNMQDAVSLCFY